MIEDKMKSAHECEVRKELKIRTIEGLRKPDLVIVSDNSILVLDVHIVHGGNMTADHENKISKYRDTPGLSEILKSKFNRDSIEYEAFTISYKGIVSSDTERLRKKLQFSDKMMNMITTSTLRGGWLNWMTFNAATTVRRPMRRGAQ